MRRISSIVFAFLFTVSGTEPQAQQATTDPVWVADRVQARNLAPVESLGAYTIRPPKDYEALKSVPDAPDMKAFGWSGKIREDGTCPAFTGAIYTVDAVKAAKLESEQLTDTFLDPARKRYSTNWKPAKPEKGTVNGIKFTRIRWSGTHADSMTDWEGFLYVAQDGNTIITMSSQDIASETKKSLPIAEAAALSFKKK